MKKLTVIAGLLATVCAFAEPVANQGWVATQITNAVNNLTAGYQAGDTILQGSITNETLSAISRDEMIMAALAQERAARVAGDALHQSVITNIVEDYVQQRDFSNSSWVNSVGVINYTEHPVLVNLADGVTLSCGGDWPEGKPVYLRVVPAGATM